MTTAQAIYSEPSGEVLVYDLRDWRRTLAWHRERALAPHEFEQQGWQAVYCCRDIEEHIRLLPNLLLATRRRDSVSRRWNGFQDFIGWSLDNGARQGEIDTWGHPHFLEAIAGRLPIDFQNYALSDNERTVAHLCAMYDTAPNKFPDAVWALRDVNGRTVAHEWLLHRPLPEWFGGWHIKSRFDRPVAFTAAMMNRLPEGFDQWDVADSTGWTVAHEAAWFGTLPLNFNKGYLTDHSHQSVQDVVRTRRKGALVS